jgi:hypothetical protein
MVAHAAASHATSAHRANVATVAGDCAGAHRAPCTLVQSEPTDLPKTENCNKREAPLYAGPISKLRNTPSGL